MATPKTKVSMQIGLEVIRSYRRLDYTAWYALAEFLDNSTQSYKDNKELLDRVYEKERTGLRVVISYDRDADLLVVRDNALGMSLIELRRALQIGRPPASTAGRSQFGLGLKTAACWFGDKWSVRTKKYGQSHGHLITVDVEKVASGEQDLPYERIKSEPDEHYTEIRIEQMHLKLKGRRLGKTKDSLKSIYRVDIRARELEIVWDNAPLQWSDDVAYLLKEDGTPEKKNFDFEVEGRRVQGWAGVLAPGSSSRGRAGFALIRRGRVIRGWPVGWRPEVIFGAAPGRNDLINQRVTGEVHLDAFDVTHTKDDINWQDDEEDEVQEGIKKAIPELLNRARTFRLQEAPKAVKLPPPEAWKVAIDAVIQTTDFGARARAVGAALSSVLSKLAPPDIADLVFKQVIDAVEQEANVVTLELGNTVLRVNVSAKIGADASYISLHKGRGNSWVLAISAMHPICALPEDVEALRIHLQHSLADGLVSWAARSGGVAADVRSDVFLKDAILRFMAGGSA